MLWGILGRLAAGLGVLLLLLFLPAGRFDFWQAWFYLGALLIPVAIMGLVLFLRDPQFLERRMQLRESSPTQKRAIGVLSLILIAVFVVPGLDRRYGWSVVPAWAAVFGDILVLIGYAWYALTLRENRFASRVVELHAGQTVIATGPYALVRHPMYLGLSLIFLASPIALASWWGLAPALLFPIALAARIADEERLLLDGLEGYRDYMQAVRYRLIPFIW
jgi:protein-S-isoprenylcysteine O-methyltransferase Ste14